MSALRPLRRAYPFGLLPVLAALAVACGGPSGSTPRLDVQPQSSAPAAPAAPATPAAPAASNAPHVMAVDPPDGATDVDPARTTISATFDRDMDPQGWAWVIENPATAPKIGESSWDAAFRVNTVQVELEPGRSYVVWVNSPDYPYFRDRAGVSAHPFRWTFTTRGAPGVAAPPVPLVRGSAAGAPAVERLEPPDGATDVDPATSVLRVTFDRPMGEGWSWVIDPQVPFPETTGKASLSADGRSAELPVRLQPGRTYAIWLNSEQHRDFHDRNGVELAPVRWTFTTRAGR